MVSTIRFGVALVVWAMGTASTANDFALNLRYQTETSAGSGRFHRLERHENWKPRETAVIVCDMWDVHHSRNAVRRLEEFAPRLDALLHEARQRGATIIHAPSDCMEAYESHPARQRAIGIPHANQYPTDIQSWCSRIPQEEQAVYPLDQTDGGDDDNPQEHADWVKYLKDLGRNPDTPWESQSPLIKIDGERDFITDRGDEVWNILEHRKIRHVVLAGVHTNMCVLGRPFGLRQMVRAGKNTVLVRDLTDTMYNPRSWPFVNHFTGTDLIVSHIERFVCPTISSDQLLGGTPFRCGQDIRPHLVIVMAELEYETSRTLPHFAAGQLGKQFRVSLVFASDEDRNSIPGLEVLDRADVALISVRRRTLPPESLQIVRRFIESGKPVVGIRTASHAFCLRREHPPAGFADWPEFDAQVFGGHYTNHHGNRLKSIVQVEERAKDHPILRGMVRDSFMQAGSLYMTAPLAAGTETLILGSVDGHPAEPAAWTFHRQDGGRSFYTSMGHPGDFQNPEFQRLLSNGILWAAGLEISPEGTSSKEQAAATWSRITVPVPGAVRVEQQAAGWYRCAVRLTDRWLKTEGTSLSISSANAQAWMNGVPLSKATASGAISWSIPAEAIQINDANLLVIRLEGGDARAPLSVAPRLSSGTNQMELAGSWQFRVGDNPAWSNIPLPARYGISTDILFEP